MSDFMDDALVVIEKAESWKRKMVAHRLSRAKADCPSCGGEGTMKITCAINHNDHIRCSCTDCGAGFIE